jgi:hypothetical protein
MVRREQVLPATATGLAFRLCRAPQAIRTALLKFERWAERLIDTFMR